VKLYKVELILVVAGQQELGGTVDIHLLKTHIL